MKSRTLHLTKWILLAIVMFAPAGTTFASEDGGLLLDDFLGVSKWSQSGWADADIDPDFIVRYVPGIRQNVGPDSEAALVATVHFKPGGYSQGVIQHGSVGDWSGYAALTVQLKLVGAAEGFKPKAKLIVFPDDRWTDAADKYDVTLVADEWVTMTVPLDVSGQEDNWFQEITPAHWANIRSWALKLYASQVPETSTPVQIIIAQPRLVMASKVTD